MHLLAHLFAVATDSTTRPGGLARSALAIWIYAQTFNALVHGTSANLVFKDVDAWVERPGTPQTRTGFTGDVQALVERLTFADPQLGMVLGLKQASPAGDRYAVGLTLTKTTDYEMRVARLRDALVGMGLGSGTDLCAPENVEHVRAALAAFVPEMEPPVLAARFVQPLDADAHASA